ncbi:Tm-1-like ATP-binding domain-containing protein [Phytohabitans sp. ZYX-F-186]|uniref:Tm-1-like ATP-binding domain-containing protein n=1 Tax=Phytohabitans maris TaxID=3071409 RepID=A0ABU0ZCD3_9ACTN|nr:Tm-1-like ATP-binding domain-containing protein [Phytohabitans sp. ZYX-F-186]MDQ7904643.1 Tm-1-like ATP-binding domain-containing protein [Phytohabitans sp. ZYX-F-186]
MVNVPTASAAQMEERGRVVHWHMPNVPLMRATSDELEEVAVDIARKANAATGRTKIIVPVRGFSSLSTDGQPFHDPRADARFIDRLIRTATVEVVVVELPINDPEFAIFAADALHDLVHGFVSNR